MHLGEFYATLGQPAKAEDQFRRALVVSRANQFAGIEVLALFGLARLARDGNRLDDALASTLAESAWANARAPHIKMELMASQQRYHELHVEVLMRLHEAKSRDGFDRRAFEASDKRRARSLLQALANKDGRSDGKTGTDWSGEGEDLRRAGTPPRPIAQDLGGVLSNVRILQLRTHYPGYGD